jgi:hypothetical protein
MLENWKIKSPIIFLGLSGLLVAYLLYTMVRRRKGLRHGFENREPEL